MPVSSPSIDAQRALEVAGEHVGDEAVLGVVGGRDRLVLVGEALDRRDRAEDLLAAAARRRRARRSARSGRRSSRRRRARGRRRPPCAPRPIASSTSSATLLALGVVDQRADLDAVLGAAPDLHRAHLRRPASRRTASATESATWKRLAAVHASPMLRIFAIIAPCDGRVDVGVVEDDERRVAAELHREPQQVLGGLLHQLAADLGRAGERQLAQARVGDQRRHRLARRRGGDEVHARRRAARPPRGS